MENQKQTSESDLKNKNFASLSSNRFLISIILSLLVTALVAGGAVYAWQNKKINQIKEEKNQQIQNLQEEITSLEEEINTLEEQLDSAEEEGDNEDVPADWKTYRNEEYGFKLSFSEIWKGYKVREKTSVSFPGVIKSIKFYAPDSPTEATGDSTNSAFVINVYERSWWDNNAGGYLKGRQLSKSEKYVLSWSQAQDLVSGLSGKQYGNISEIKESFEKIDTSS